MATSTDHATTASAHSEHYAEWLRQMLLIRRFEERAGEAYAVGQIGGFCHLYIGQEAVVVGMQMAIGEGDQVITGYRDHGHMLACGMDPKGVMAELIDQREAMLAGEDAHEGDEVTDEDVLSHALGSPVGGVRDQTPLITAATAG